MPALAASLPTAFQPDFGSYLDSREISRPEAKKEGSCAGRDRHIGSELFEIVTYIFTGTRSDEALGLRPPPSARNRVYRRAPTGFMCMRVAFF